MTDLKKRRLLVAEYSAVQVFYWIGWCCVGTNGALFLRSRGFDSSTLGVIMALGNIGGFFLAPEVASLIDRSRKITVYHCLYVLLALEILFELGLIRFPGSTPAVAVIFILLLAIVAAVNPLNTQLCFEMDHTGKYINYGVSRSCGSMGYTPVVFLIGRLCTDISPEILPRAGIIAILAQLAVLTLIVVMHRRIDRSGLTENNRPRQPGTTLLQFFQQNRRFIFFSLGTTLLAFSSSLLSTYLIYIVENLGGNAADQGAFNAVSALVEVPMMLLYTRVTRSIRCSTAIRVAAVMYAVKNLAYVLAGSLKFLYFTTFTQTFSYALLIPALVDYTGLVVHYRDSAKGQAVSATMLTLGTIFANLIGGILIAHLTVTQSMWVGFAVACIGAAVVWVFVDRKKA